MQGSAVNIARASLELQGPHAGHPTLSVTCQSSVTGYLSSAQEMFIRLVSYEPPSHHKAVLPLQAHGTPCFASHDAGHCYAGHCASHASQCRLLWGPSAIKSDNQCFRLNTRGDNKGNCGYKGGSRELLKACQKEDVLCGMLHCSHLSEKLRFGMKNVATQSQTFLKNGKTVLPCRNALVDLGLDQTDPGLVPSGASCGQGKMCLSHKCVPIGEE